MGIFDSAKDAAENLAAEHPDQVSEGLDKVGELADEKTGGQYSDQIEGGVDKAKDALGGLGD